MAPGFNARLLHLWEQGSNPDVNIRAAGALASWDLAEGGALYERDVRLLDLRQALFGPVLDGVVECPTCRTEFEIEVDLGALECGAVAPEPVEVQADGFVLVARPPRAEDLIAVGDALEGAEAADALFGRCVVRLERDGLPIAPEQAPASLRTAAAEAMSARGMESPFLDLVCGACTQAWRAPLDIARSLLAELDSSAGRLLDDVHRLAAAYHWSERDILALTPRRRRHYLEAIG